MTDTAGPKDESPADEAPDEPPANEPPTREPPTDEPPSGEQAARVVVSYPADLSEWGRHQVDTHHFRGYLRKTLGAVAEGDAWEEFVGVGCCGDTLDVPLRIEAVEGGDRVGPGTIVEYDVREACGVQGNWAVQSQGGPTQ